jgi:exosortase K
VKRAVDAAVVVVALAAAYGLKRHYSVATADELDWMLAPTAAMVEVVVGSDFEREAGVGYLSRERYFAIAKPCAGVNFLIVAFLAPVLAFVRGRRTVAGKLALLAGAAASAYLFALGVNTLRIAIAVELHPELAALGAAARERLHRIEGVVVYLAALVLGFVAARRVLEGRRVA